MRVLVSGASGFLGGAVCRDLGERGHEPLAMVRRPGSGPGEVAEFEGDLADAESLERVLGAARPEVVVHLAAETGARSRRASACCDALLSRASSSGPRMSTAPVAGSSPSSSTAFAGRAASP